MNMSAEGSTGFGHLFVRVNTHRVEGFDHFLAAGHLPGDSEVGEGEFAEFDVMDEPAVPLVVTPARAIAVAMDSATDEVLIMRSVPSAGWIHGRTGPGVERQARCGFWGSPAGRWSAWTPRTHDDSG